MGKTKSRKKMGLEDLSPIARALLRAMAAQPDRIEYMTRVLGGAFEDPDVARLDQAYDELAKEGLIERSGSGISFFGAWKDLYRITEAGKALVIGEPRP